MAIAFLNSNFNKEVYLYPLIGFIENKNKVLYLIKALYKLKQALRQ
jgi:hypothetical protein